jgi:argininosuccinate lyase
MLEAVKANYSSTTDLADMAAQSSGVGYRQVYAVIGRLVDGLIERGRPLSDLTAQEIVRAGSEAGLDITLSDGQVAEALDPARAVAARKHMGGAAPAEMARMLAGRTRTLDDHCGWAAARRKEIDAARARTAAASAALRERRVKPASEPEDVYHSADTGVGS